MLLHSCSRNAGGWLPSPTSGQGQPSACVYLISSRVCTYLLYHVKLPFTPQEQSAAPPFLRPGVSDEEVNALFKRPGSVIKACLAPFVCVSMYAHNRRRIDTRVMTFHVLYIYTAKAPAYLKGGSSHRPIIGKPLGYHPMEPKSGQRTPKKGLGLGHVLTTSHAVVA